MCPNHEECRPTLYSPFNRFLFRVNPIFSLCFGFYAVMLPSARAWGESVVGGGMLVKLFCLDFGSSFIFFVWSLDQCKYLKKSKTK